MQSTSSGDLNESHYRCAIVALTLLSACATAPAVYDVQNSRVVPAGKDIVWERVVEFFASNNLSIKTTEKDSGIIAAERMIGAPQAGGNLAGWASCGSAALEIPASEMADPASNGGTNVTVNTRFSETRRFGNTPTTTATCNSNGPLEKQILDAASGN